MRSRSAPVLPVDVVMMENSGTVYENAATVAAAVPLLAVPWNFSCLVADKLKFVPVSRPRGLLWQCNTTQRAGGGTYAALLGKMKVK